MPDTGCARKHHGEGRRLARAACSGHVVFALVGILAGIAQVLAQHKIPIFAISTYNTDYILLKQAHYPCALSALANAGYTIEE